MTVPSDNEYDEAVHLGIKDVAVDNARHPSIMQIRINLKHTRSTKESAYMWARQAHTSAQ